MDNANAQIAHIYFLLQKNLNLFMLCNIRKKKMVVTCEKKNKGKEKQITVLGSSETGSNAF
jgi:hypothetical protein